MANQRTKVQVSSLSHSRDILGREQKFKMRHMTSQCPFQGQFIGHRLGLVMINLHTKFEVSVFTHYEDIKRLPLLHLFNGLFIGQPG